MKKIIFFDTTESKAALLALIKEMSEVASSDDFFTKTKDTLYQLFQDIIEHPSRWDNRCQITLNNSSQQNIFSDKRKGNDKPIDQEFLDDLLISILPYALEFELSSGDNIYPEHMIFMNLIEWGFENFSKKTQSAIRRERDKIAIGFAKHLVENSDARSLNDYFSAVKSSEVNFEEFEEKLKKNRDEWDRTYKARVLKVSRLEKRLKKQESQFNFVGLHKGFSDLLLQKKNEYKWLRNIMFGLSFLIITPIICELIYFLIKGVEVRAAFDLIKFVPAFTLTLIFIYYFKICLNNFSSVKAQIMQIRLRMSLCQFIQSYADYAKEIRSEDGNPLGKFEDVIFSNIMGSEEKMPATFDGLDNIASLINAIKPSK